MPMSNQFPARSMCPPFDAARHGIVFAQKRLIRQTEI